MQFVFDVEQAFRFGLHDASQRNAGDVGDHLLDVLHVHQPLLGLHVALPVTLAPLQIRLQLAYLIAHRGRLLVVLAVDQIALLDGEALDLLVQAAECLGAHAVVDALARPRLVEQIDRLVRQAAVADVALRQVHGRLERLVGVDHLMVLGVAILDALEDLDGILDLGFFHEHRLETPLQGGVALDVLAKLVEGGSTDTLQLTA